jgi:hypothetical protein
MKRHVITLLICVAVFFVVIFFIFKQKGVIFFNKSEDMVTVEYWLGKTLYNPNNINNPNQLSIISYIDGNCGQCIHDLHKWKDVIKKLGKTQKVNYIFYTYSYDFASLSKYCDSIVGFPIELTYDSLNVFYTTNNLDQDKRFQTFLVDNNDVILIVGNPIFSKDLLDLYSYEINKYFNIH